MGDILVDGTVKAAFVPATPGIASIAAPKVSELTAATTLDLTERLTADGLAGFAPDTASVDNGSLAMQGTTQAGTATLGTLALRLKKLDGETDPIYAALAYHTKGLLVIRRWVDWEDPFATGDEIDVIPVECGRRKPMDYDANSVARYEVPIFNPSKAEWGVLVVAGA